MNFSSQHAGIWILLWVQNSKGHISLIQLHLYSINYCLWNQFVKSKEAFKLSLRPSCYLWISLSSTLSQFLKCKTLSVLIYIELALNYYSYSNSHICQTFHMPGPDLNSTIVTFQYHFHLAVKKKKTDHRGRASHSIILTLRVQVCVHVYACIWDYQTQSNMHAIAIVIHNSVLQRQIWLCLVSVFLSDIWWIEGVWVWILTNSFISRPTFSPAVRSPCLTPGLYDIFTSRCICWKMHLLHEALIHMMKSLFYLTI